MWCDEEAVCWNTSSYTDFYPHCSEFDLYTRSQNTELHIQVKLSIRISRETSGRWVRWALQPSQESSVKTLCPVFISVLQLILNSACATESRCATAAEQQGAPPARLCSSGFTFTFNGQSEDLQTGTGPEHLDTSVRAEVKISVLLKKLVNPSDCLLSPSAARLRSDHVIDYRARWWLTVWQ